MISVTCFSQVNETQEKVRIVETPPSSENSISEIPDKDAEFPGGPGEMMKFISQSVVYPQDAIEMNEQGRVYISFIVEKDGSLTEIKVEKGVSATIDAEAIRVIELMPKWIPGELAGVPVRTKAMMPINFTLSGDEVDEEENRKYFDAHWAGFDFGTLILMSDLFKTDFHNNDYWNNKIIRSATYNFNFFDVKFPIIKQYLGLTTGLGWNISTIGLSSNYDINHTADTLFATVNATQEYRVNNLNVQYITLPLLLEFATKQDQKKSFYLAAGVIGGVRVYSNTTKTGKYSNGDFFNLNVRSKYNFAPFSLEATVRSGYGPIGLFATYNLTTLFKEGKTVAVYPFRAGLSLNIDYGK